MQSMYMNAWSHVRVNGTFIEDFLAQVGLHQSFVLRPVFFIIVLEAIYREIRSGYSEEMLSADELVLIKHLKAWKKTISLKVIIGDKRWKGLRLNVKKMKMITSSENAGKVIVEGKFSCVAHRKGVDSNSTFPHQFCRYWVHRKYIGIRS